MNGEVLNGAFGWVRVVLPEVSSKRAYDPAVAKGREGCFKGRTKSVVRRPPHCRVFQRRADDDPGGAHPGPVTEHVEWVETPRPSRTAAILDSGGQGDRPPSRDR